MPVKTTVRCHPTPVRMAVVKDKREDVVVRMWKKGNPEDWL